MRKSRPALTLHVLKMRASPHLSLRAQHPHYPADTAVAACECPLSSCEASETARADPVAYLGLRVQAPVQPHPAHPAQRAASGKKRWEYSLPPPESWTSLSLFLRPLRRACHCAAPVPNRHNRAEDDYSLLQSEEIRFTRVSTLRSKNSSGARR